MKGGRKLSKWNLFVKKIYWEGKNKDSNYEFKNALIDAKARKSEMGNSTFRVKNKSKKNKSKKNTNFAMKKSRRRQ